MDADLTTRILLSGYSVVYTKQVARHHYLDQGIVSWTDPKGRKKRKLAALDLYHTKYSELIDAMNNGTLRRLGTRAKNRIV